MNKVIIFALIATAAFALTCADGTYGMHSVCLPCHPSCATCSGDKDEDCLSCPANFTLLKNSEKPPSSGSSPSSRRILSDSGSSSDSDSDSSHHPGDPNAGECKCSTAGQKPLGDGTCGTPAADTCTGMTFFDVDECKKCTKGCKTCTAEGADKCSSCGTALLQTHSAATPGACTCTDAAQYTFDLDTCKAADACGDGYWADATNKACVPCPPGATTCTSATADVVCATGLTANTKDGKVKCECADETQYAKLDGNIQTCTACTEIPNCAKCNREGCAQCATGYRPNKTMPGQCEVDTKDGEESDGESSSVDDTMVSGSVILTVFSGLLAIAALF